MILMLFTATFYNFLFLRYFLVLVEHHFPSDILVPFPDSNNMCGMWRKYGEGTLILEVILKLFNFNCKFWKKCKTSKNCYNLGPTWTKKGLSVWMGHIQNEKEDFMQKQLTKAYHKLWKTFYFTTYQLFLLNCESFSNLCEGLLVKKRVISSLKHVRRFRLFYLPITASFTFSSALLSADTCVASYLPEFH